MHKVMIKARDGKILRGGVKQIVSEQPTLLTALNYADAMVTEQEANIDTITIKFVDK